MKVLVKEGWADKETGKKGEPRLQFMLIQYLQDVLPSFAKKLVIHMNIKDLQTDLVHQLNAVFQENKGDNTVTFEIMELEKVKIQVESVPVIAESEEVSLIEDSEDSEYSEVLESELPELSVSTELEETKIITRLSMPSRKLKIKISNALLQELEKLPINFKLN